MTESGDRDYVEDLAATMLASTLGIEFDPDAAWDERKHSRARHSRGIARCAANCAI